MLQKKTVALMAAVVLSLASLTACASTSTSSNTPQKTKELSGDDLSEHFVFYQDLPDGRRVMCIWAGWGSSGGPSCDWVGLHKQDQPTSTPEPSPSPTF